jgi:hypothetical protein
MGQIKDDFMFLKVIYKPKPIAYPTLPHSMAKTN